MTGCKTMLAPTQLKTALELLGKLEGNATVLGGGTDLFVAARLKPEAGILKDTLVCVKDIPELSNIYEDESKVHIGAACALADVIDSDIVQRYIPLLADAALRIASPQIRNAGTIGGNVINASPAGDGLTALVCLGAKAVLGSLDSGGDIRYRAAAVSDFVTGPRKTSIKPNELLIRFEIPKYDGGRHIYEKIGVRSAMAIAVASVAIQQEKGGALQIALGSMGPKTVICHEAEKAAEAGRIDDAIGLIMAVCSPIGDIRASAEYRMAAVRKLLARGLGMLRGGCI